MKNLVTIIVITGLLSLSMNTQANEKDAMVEMIVNMMKQSVDIDSLSNCLGVTETNFINAYTKTIEACIPKDGLEGSCMEELAPKYLVYQKLNSIHVPLMMKWLTRKRI